MTCPQPSMTVHFNLTPLVRSIAHGTRHMQVADLAMRAALLVGCLVATVWMIHDGAVVWSLVVGIVGALSLAVDAVELYAVGAVCDRLAAQEEE